MSFQPSKWTHYYEPEVLTWSENKTNVITKEIYYVPPIYISIASPLYGQWNWSCRNWDGSYKVTC